MSGTLIGVLLGGALTLAGTFAVKLWDEWREARGLRGAFRAEISALLAIVETRKHEESAKAVLALWKSGTDYPLEFFGAEQAQRDPVFEANVGKIGSIGAPLAEDVTRFYMQLLAVRITVRAFEKGGYAQALPIETRIWLVEEALRLWQPTKELGASLVARL
jgi:hypothetical protein